MRAADLPEGSLIEVQEQADGAKQFQGSLVIVAAVTPSSYVEGWVKVVARTSKGRGIALLYEADTEFELKESAEKPQEARRYCICTDDRGKKLTRFQKRDEALDSLMRHYSYAGAHEVKECPDSHFWHVVRTAR